MALKKKKAAGSSSKAPVAPQRIRSQPEREAAQRIVRQFEGSAISLPDRLASFPAWVRRQDMTRFLARYEIFKRVLPIKGSIVECGVYFGAGLFSWAHFSSILEPCNFLRHVYGFDTFEGFPSVAEADSNSLRDTKVGELRADCQDELNELIAAHDQNRPLGHIPKVSLIKGDATKTIPRFMEQNPQLVVSLMFLDFDLYEPSKVAMKHFVPRIPRGGIIVFDQLDNPAWPGETVALKEVFGINNFRLERSLFEPNMCFAVVGE